MGEIQGFAREVANQRTQRGFVVVIYNASQSKLVNISPQVLTCDGSLVRFIYLFYFLFITIYVTQKQKQKGQRPHIKANHQWY